MISKTITDSTLAANEITREFIHADRMEEILKSELSSEDLFKIDSAILSSLKKTQDFSADLLKQLEIGNFEKVFEVKSIDKQLENIQRQIITDITSPLQDMFNNMADLVTAEMMK